MACDGRLLLISDNPVLFQLLGTTYGGDGQTTFALPDLRGRNIIGASAADPIGTVVGHDKCDPDERTNTQRAWPPGGGALRQPPAVAGDGVFDRAARNFPNSHPPFPAFRMAQRRFSVRSSVLPEPSSRAVGLSATGSLLQINQNQALFALLGTTYGGDGHTTFALPDLRDRTVIGTGNGITVF